MKKADITIYREIQRNAEMAIKSIETISNKVYDDQLALQIQRQADKYTEIKTRAFQRLKQCHAEPYHTNQLQDLMLTGGIHYNTLLNNSTSHIAELMIKGSNMGILEMNKVLNQNADAQEQSIALAKELIDFENRNIERLTKYL